jgi:hypothetical protein
LGEATSSVGSRGASVVISTTSVVMSTLLAFSRPSCYLVQHSKFQPIMAAGADRKFGGCHVNFLFNKREKNR